MLARRASSICAACATEMPGGSRATRLSQFQRVVERVPGQRAWGKARPRLDGYEQLELRRETQHAESGRGDADDGHRLARDAERASHRAGSARKKRRQK